ncbi:hypothetical protein E4T56_gene9914, partial [Termitomyces sp. T112]
MAASGSRPALPRGLTPASSSTAHRPRTRSQPPSPLGLPPEASTSSRTTMTVIPEAHDAEICAHEDSDPSSDDLGVDFEEPPSGGLGEAFTGSHVTYAPLPTGDMTPSGEASAASARYLPSLVSSAAPLASLPPRTAANSAASLDTTRSVSPLAPSPPSAAADPPSPASPLSPKKTAGRRASKCPATTPAPQLSLDTAESFLHSLDAPSVPPSGPVTSVGPSGSTSPTTASDCLTISRAALADLLQRYSVDIAQIVLSTVHQQLPSGIPAGPQIAGLQPAFHLSSIAALPQSTGLQPALQPVLPHSSHTPLQSGLHPLSTPCLSSTAIEPLAPTSVYGRPGQHAPTHYMHHSRAPPSLTSWGIGFTLNGKWLAWKLLPGWMSPDCNIGWAKMDGRKERIGKGPPHKLSPPPLQLQMPGSEPDIISRLPLTPFSMSAFNPAYNPVGYPTDAYGRPLLENSYAPFYPGPFADQYVPRHWTPDPNQAFYAPSISQGIPPGWSHPPAFHANGNNPCINPRGYSAAPPTPPTSPPPITMRTQSPLQPQQQRIEAYAQQRDKVLRFLRLSPAEFARCTRTLLTNLGYPNASTTPEVWADRLLNFHECYLQGNLPENTQGTLSINDNLWNKLHALVKEIHTSPNPRPFEDPLDPAHSFHVQCEEPVGTRNEAPSSVPHQQEELNAASSILRNLNPAGGPRPAQCPAPSEPGTNPLPLNSVPNDRPYASTTTTGPSPISMSQATPPTNTPCAMGPNETNPPPLHPPPPPLLPPPPPPLHHPPPPTPPPHPRTPPTPTPHHPPP